MSDLKPFFTFYGGKWRAAPRYPKPECGVIVEPFAGSAGYSLRYHDRAVVLCDKDPKIAGLWKYLTRVGEDEVLSLPDVPDGADVREMGLPQEATWLIGFWLNKGSAQPRNKPSRWMRDRIRPKSFWGPEVRERIAAQLRYIRHWHVYECDYRSVPFNGKATWFIDPPYCEAGRHYKFTGLDYAKLGRWCKSRPGQTIVCEQAGAGWLDFEPIGDFKSNNHTRRSAEVIWTDA